MSSRQHHSREEEHALIPFNAHLTTEASNLWTRLGFSEITDSRIESPILEEAKSRVAQRYPGAAEAGPQTTVTLLLREVIKVLAGGVYHKRIREARETTTEEEREQLFTQVTALLTPPSSSTETIPTCPLDPRSWAIASIRAENETYRLLRLSHLASAMLCQEKGVQQADLTLVEAVVQLTPAAATPATSPG